MTKFSSHLSLEDEETQALFTIDMKETLTRKQLHISLMGTSMHFDAPSTVVFSK
jgi:hypothetical protein